MLSTFTCYKDLESYFYVMKSSIVIFSGFLWLMIASILNASSTTQTLLDQLERAQSMDEAGPIVDKLWKEWTSAHKNSDETVSYTHLTLPTNSGV